MDVPGVGRMAFLKDPTGANIAIFKGAEHAGMAQVGSVPGAMGWGELHTRDTDAAKALYTELFNWGAKVDERSIGGMMAMTEAHGDAPPHWLPYMLVEDCDASAAKVQEFGGALVVPPMDVPDVGKSDHQVGRRGIEPYPALFEKRRRRRLS